MAKEKGLQERGGTGEPDLRRLLGGNQRGVRLLLSVGLLWSARRSHSFGMPAFIDVEVIAGEGARFLGIAATIAGAAVVAFFGSWDFLRFVSPLLSSTRAEAAGTRDLPMEREHVGHSERDHSGRRTRT